MKTFLFSIFLLLLMKAPAQDKFHKYAVKYFNFVSQQQKLKMAYLYEKSSAPNGKTVILLHGKNFSGSYWTETISKLLEKGYNVLAPDQIGFGMSSMPACYQYSFQQLAFNTHQLINSLGITNEIVLGHSMGGMLAVRYALMYPQDCSQLILEDPIGLEDWKLTVPYSTIDDEYKTELNTTSATLKKYMLQNYFHNEWKNDYDKLLDESSKNLGDSAYAWNMAETSDMIFTEPVCYEFNSIKVPTVLMIGLFDRTAIGKDKVDAETASMLGDYPALGKKTEALIPQCKLIELKGIGHIPHIEDFSMFIQNLLKVIQ
jgi:pimeloyl-ACP methyl ester carboxylesterase